LFKLRGTDRDNEATLALSNHGPGPQMGESISVG
jgi:hypothetical protein